MRYPFVGESYTLRSPTAALQSSINIMPQFLDDPNERGKNTAEMQACPGYHLIKTLPHGNVRGVWSGGGRLFVMSGSHLYEVAQGSYVGGNPSTGTGTIVSDHDIGVNDTLPVNMFGNGNQLGIVANGLFYYDNGAGPVGATFSGGGSAVTALTGTYLDGAAYVQRPSGGSPDLGRQFNFSAVNDFTNWNALDFNTKESSPDYLNSILADREQLYLFGTESGEVWQNDPNTGLPVRIPGAAAKIGSGARWAPVSLGGTIYFLGGGATGNPVAYKLSGFTPIRISTHAEESAWASAGQLPSPAIAYPTIEDGHLLWVINFAFSLNSWVYDATASAQFGTPMWHQRAFWDGTQFLPYKPWFHTFIPEWGANGMHIGGDYNSGNIYEMNMAYPDANGSDIKMVRALPYRYNAGKRMFFGRMQLNGNVTSASRDYSDDKGATWSTPETSIGSGRVFWPTGGSSDERVWRLSVTTSALGTPASLVDLECEETAGDV